jgi:acyl-CoA thioesterase FadM
MGRRLQDLMSWQDVHIKVSRMLGPFSSKCQGCIRRQAEIVKFEAQIKELESKVAELNLRLSSGDTPDQPVVSIEAVPVESGWAHLKASVQGFRKPFLQDAHDLVIEGENAVLIVCDGAGSLKHSKAGADFVVKHLSAQFLELIKAGEVFTQETWTERARAFFHDASQSLKTKSQTDRLNFSDFGCTCIVVFAGPDFVACAHVGDGRAGYLDALGHWRALMTPHKGALANSTVFMTMLEPASLEQLVRVMFVPVRTRAVVALSDGPEDVCWKVSTFDPSGQKVIDPNQPSNEFLGKIANQLAGAAAKNVPQQKLDKLWQDFLTEGTPKLKTQVDDKTLLLALRG